MATNTNNQSSVIAHFHGIAVGDVKEIHISIRLVKEGEASGTYSIEVNQWGLPSVTSNLDQCQALGLFRHYTDEYFSAVMP